MSEGDEKLGYPPDSGPELCPLKLVAHQLRPASLCFSEHLHGESSRCHWEQ